MWVLPTPGPPTSVMEIPLSWSCTCSWPGGHRSLRQTSGRSWSSVKLLCCIPGDLSLTFLTLAWLLPHFSFHISSGVLNPELCYHCLAELSPLLSRNLKGNVGHVHLSLNMLPCLKIFVLEDKYCWFCSLEVSSVEHLPSVQTYSPSTCINEWNFKKWWGGVLSQ